MGFSVVLTLCSPGLVCVGLLGEEVAEAIEAC